MGRVSATCDGPRPVGQSVLVPDPDFADWNAAAFTSLDQTDPELAQRLSARLVDRFLARAGLSAIRREEALGQTTIELGVTPKGVRLLRVTLPLGAGHPENSWDGSSANAEAIVDAMAEHAAEDVVWDQENVGPTGWEPEFDEG